MYRYLYMHTFLPPPSHVYTSSYTPPSLLFLVQRIREVGEKLGLQPLVIQGKELEEKGFGG